MTAGSTRAAGQVWGVVLAAGASRRAGAVKALATLRGEALVTRAVRCLREGGCAGVVVVVGPPHDAGVAAALPDAIVVRNPDPGRGMSTSLALSVAEVQARGGAAAVVSLVDHPAVSATTVRALVGAWAASAAVVVRPRFEGRRGHPFVVDAALFGPIASLPVGASPRPLLRGAQPQITLEVDDPAVLQDLDSGSELRAAGVELDPET